MRDKMVLTEQEADGHTWSTTEKGAEIKEKTKKQRRKCSL